MRFPRRLAAYSVVAIGMAAIVMVALALRSAIPFSSEMARSRIAGFLAARLDSDVELQEVKLRLLPALRIEGSGLQIRHRGRRDVPPLIVIERFTAETGLATLLRRHVSRVTVQGLDIQIPPDRNRSAEDIAKDREPQSTAGDQAQRDRDDARGKDAGFSRTIVVDELISNDSRLVIIPREAGKPPKVWAIHRLQMRSLGIDQAMPFDALLTNAVPPGEIKTSGSFGPWHADEPGDTPLHGRFDFAHADLGVFKGIAGILSARGSFGGTLDRLEIDGQTDTPDFTVTAAGNPVPLRTTYHAIVDGTNGDTILNPVNASFLETSLVAKGAVVGAAGKDGRTVTLDVTMERARLQDVLTLAVKSRRPPMTGTLRLTTKLVLPPGDVDVVKKLQLQGHFAIAATRFTDPGIQTKINELSQRTQGKTDDAEAARVSSHFDGTFALAGGTLTIPSVTFDVPGAAVQLSGGYELLSETIHFAGTARTDATISQMTTGWKSKLLKFVDPLFEKQGGGGSEIPFKITGTRANPSFGFDKRRFFQRRGEKPAGDRR